MRHSVVCCPVCDTSSVDAAAAILKVLCNWQFHVVSSLSPNFLIWFLVPKDVTLRKELLLQHFDKKSDSLYNKVSFYRQRLKVTTEADSLRWLKSVDDNLKLQPKLSSFRKEKFQLLFSLWLLVRVWSKLVKSPTRFLFIFS
jgi:hypothetical protein